MYKSLIAATASVGLAALSVAAPAQTGNGSRSAPGLLVSGSGRFSAARSRHAKSMSFRHHRRRRSITAPVVYGPPAWSPAWYDYCGRYPDFDPLTGYYVGPGGRPYFCG
jgi:hypothetical protein